MAFFSDMQAALDALRAALGEDVDAVHIPAVIPRLADGDVIALIESATALVRGSESVRIAASGVVASRSTRDDGHTGLAQKRGHRSPVSLIQDLTGSTRADPTKQVRLGEAIAAGVASVMNDPGTHIDESENTRTDAAAPPNLSKQTPSRPWHAVLGDALMTGTLTSAQHDAIFRGLGDPPFATAEPEGELDNGCSPAPSDTANTLIAAWAAAAEQLAGEAAGRTVEELATASRSIRDLLDPVGAERRFEERFRARSFRMWVDREGTHHGSIVFDDEMAAWIRAIIDTALRPRRGGPRFVDPTKPPAPSNSPKTHAPTTSSPMTSSSTRSVPALSPTPPPCSAPARPASAS